MYAIMGPFCCLMSLLSFFSFLHLEGGKGNKRKNDVSIEKENAFVEKPVKIEIPSALKKQLVDDWEFVNHQLLKSNLCMKVCFCKSSTM
ncbi:hypothetical protein L2E82_22216 [Cichorium intybus]|uniref:Uncharacterized protein n=1 Tax=Cichorium intybus TaxID=13427 RepID=A0ACB9DX93_CICIN|nr:hypothetical protein L2E82_22216 [Cichorium intybus]